MTPLMLTAPPNTRASHSASAAATIASTPTDAATATAEPTATKAAASVEPSASQGPEATPTPAGARPTGVAVAATTCTGTSQFTDLFAEAAAQEPFDVYCAVLPDEYWIKSGSYTLPNGGNVTIEYVNARGFKLALEEGNVCPDGLSACGVNGAPSGTIRLGDLTADLYATAMPVDSAGTIEVYMAFAQAGAGRMYGLTGYGMSQATFVELAATLVKVAAS
jgi:hypothetical protein